MVFAARGGRYAHLITDAGHPLRCLEPGPGDQQAFLDAILSMGPGTSRDFYTDDELRTAIDAEVELLHDTGAGLAVTGFTLSAYVSTRVAGVPLATDHGGSFLPPVLSHGLCPAPVNAPDPNLARLPSRLQRWLANRVPALLNGPVQQLNRHAHERGVEPVPGLLGLMCGDLTLVTESPSVLGMTSEQLTQWRARWPFRVRNGTTFRFTGPLYAELDIPLPEQVEDFLRRTRSVLFVSPTSVTRTLLCSLIDAARDTGADVLVAAGPHDVHYLADDHVLICDILPNHLVMPRVDAAVIMGGQGSVQTAMAAGTPFVGLPLHGEQELNVAVAERLGMAIRMSPDPLVEARLSEALRDLLEAPRYASAARRAAAMYDGLDGASTAADTILEWLA